jgi:Rad3-related DNA helicase
MADGDQNITVNEVYRLLERIDKRLDTLVSRDEFKAVQQNWQQQMLQMEQTLNDRSLQAQREHATLDAARDKESAREAVNLQRVETELEKQITRIDAQSAKQAEARKQIWTAVGLAVLAVVLDLFKGVLFPGIG